MRADLEDPTKLEAGPLAPYWLPRKASNARLCVGADPHIGSRRVFDDWQAFARRPGSDLST